MAIYSSGQNFRVSQLVNQRRVSNLSASFQLMHSTLFVCAHEGVKRIDRLSWSTRVHVLKGCVKKDLVHLLTFESFQCVVEESVNYIEETKQDV